MLIIFKIGKNKRIPGGEKCEKMRKRSFHELVMENKKELMTNTEYLHQLEEKLEQRFKQK